MAGSYRRTHPRSGLSVPPLVARRSTSVLDDRPHRTTIDRVMLAVDRGVHLIGEQLPS